MPDGPMCNPALHVLVAEDEASVALVIDEDLTECGFRVTCAPDGAVALTELSAHPFDAVVTDIRMPNLDGVSLVRSILATFPRMPIVVLSGYMTAQQREELLALGVPAEALLEKPSGFRDLRSTLIRLLSAAHP